MEANMVPEAADVAGEAGAARLHARIPTLDGIRGIAVLMVMLCHFTNHGLPTTVVGKLVRRPFEAGWSGVDLFFVLSGFLITGILYDAKSQTHYFRNFYVRRTLRIFPLYYGFLIVLFWILPHLHPFTPSMSAAAARQGWLWSYSANLVMAREARWIFIADWLNVGQFWTLAIEEQFYLLWPLVVFLLPRVTLVRVCLALMVTSLTLRSALLLHGAHPITVGMFTLCRFDSLAMGAAAALLLRGNAVPTFQWARRLTPYLLGALVVITLSRKRWDAADPVVQSLGFTVLGLFFAGVLLIAVAPKSPRWVAHTLGNRFFRWFGAYSYAMYVFHVALMPIFARLTPVERISATVHSSYMGVAIYALFAISVTSALAFLSWHLYEKRFLALRKHFVVSDAPAKGLPVGTDAKLAYPVAIARSGIAEHAGG
jgi:peptidoglycan/LPS O-acetylase OafA/YrhL